MTCKNGEAASDAGSSRRAFLAASSPCLAVTATSRSFSLSETERG